ncbi:MAG TPA: hypothetical protein VHZ24_15925 [Pirellulales bacterium]|jgi:hypothetical protein|nr:hypothetical protein [Pirellulales bacterium]
MCTIIEIMHDEPIHISWRIDRGGGSSFMPPRMVAAAEAAGADAPTDVGWLTGTATAAGAALRAVALAGAAAAGFAAATGLAVAGDVAAAPFAGRAIGAAVDACPVAADAGGTTG